MAKRPIPPGLLRAAADITAVSKRKRREATLPEIGRSFARGLAEGGVGLGDLGLAALSGGNPALAEAYQRFIATPEMRALEREYPSGGTNEEMLARFAGIGATSLVAPLPGAAPAVAAREAAVPLVEARAALDVPTFLRRGINPAEIERVNGAIRTAAIDQRNTAFNALFPTGNVRRQPRALLANPTRRTAEQVHSAIVQNGGVTFDVKAGAPTTASGYAVADPKYTLLIDATDPNPSSTMADWLSRPTVQRRLNRSGSHVGGWRNPETGQIEINVTDIGENRNTMLRLGRARKQIAIGQLEGGNYQGDVPVSPPETITAPAVLDGETVYTGVNHGEAWDRAINRFSDPIENPKLTTSENEGFLTSQNRYVDRAEAARIAGRAKRPGDELLAGGDVMNRTPLEPAGLPAPPTPAPGAVEQRVLPSVVSAGSPAILPSIGLDWRKGIPGIAAIERRLPGTTPEGILPNVAPGSLTGRAQTELARVPQAKRASTWMQHFADLERAFRNPEWERDVIRGVERGGHLWYTSDPILASAIKVLGPHAGREAFEEWARLMGPTSLQTSPIQNLRNAGFRYVTEPTTPLEQLTRQGPPGFRALYPTQMGEILGRLRQAGALDPLQYPKISRYAENIMGNWQPATLDVHEARRLSQLGMQMTADPTAFYGPAESLYQTRAEELMREGILPVPKGLSPTAAAQAARWVGGAEHTGVRGGAQAASQSLSDLFARGVFRTMAETGQTPEDVLRLFWTRQQPLF